MRRLDLAVAVSILLLIAVGSTPQTENVSVPNLIRYGGTLKDANGTPVDSGYCVSSVSNNSSVITAGIKTRALSQGPTNFNSSTTDPS